MSGSAVPHVESVVRMQDDHIFIEGFRLALKTDLKPSNENPFDAYKINLILLLKNQFIPFQSKT